MYIYDQHGWPDFEWDSAALTSLLTEARYRQGRLLGRMGAFGFSMREEATVHMLTQDVVKSSEIEGEKLDAETVRSSIAKRLGLEMGGSAPADRHVEGIVEVMLDATRNYNSPLTPERLFGWHAALFPTGRSGMRKITVGNWRTDETGPMQVVSGPIGKETVHYEAPAHDRLQHEMESYCAWFNTSSETDPVIRSALAHFRFVTIHPFDDGNGRIARALADMALAQGEKTQQRFYSMSAQIQRERKAYYDILERSQKGTLDLTPWLTWYLSCLTHAIDASDEMLKSVLAKATFWKRYTTEPLNKRQQKVINRLLDGFKGKLTSSKWAKLTKCSQDTALRDIHDLLDRGILTQSDAGGRSTHYYLADEASANEGG